MAMAPGDLDAILQRGLDAARQWEKKPLGGREQAEAGETASGALVLLDRQLRDGGPLPSAWSAAR